MPYKIAHTLLLFYCLTSQTYTSCQQDVSRRAPGKKNLEGVFASLKGSFATVQRITDTGGADDALCSAVWIDEAYLITAASCLEPEILAFDDLLSKSYKVNVFQMLEGRDSRPKDDEGLPSHFDFLYNSMDRRPGKAILHPLFERNDFRPSPKAKLPLIKEFRNLQLLPLAYDVALVKVDKMKHHNKSDLCKEQNVNKDNNGKELSTWTALGMKNRETWQFFGRMKKPEFFQEWERIDDGIGPKGPSIPIVHEWQQLFSEPTPEQTMGVYMFDQMVFIDPYKQFTTYFKNEKEVRELFGINGGVPILTSDEASVKCIAGIMSYSGQKDGHLYITSTKVYTKEIQKWIEHAKVIITKMGNGKKAKLNKEANLAHFAKTQVKQNFPLNETERTKFKDPRFSIQLIKDTKTTKTKITFSPGCPFKYPQC